jgi:hypothetical protein
MARWIYRYAPDEYASLCIVMNRLRGKRLKGFGVKPLYKRLRAEMREELVRAALERNVEEVRDYTPVPRRENGRFVFEWIREDSGQEAGES